MSGGCLGAGTGTGSCPAPPFRAAEEEIEHSDGCPDYAPCCSEYGYCQTSVIYSMINLKIVRSIMFFFLTGLMVSWRFP